MTIQTKVAGITFRIAEHPSLASFKPKIGSQCVLVHDKENQYDQHAVQVFNINEKAKGVCVGYFPKNSKVQQLFHAGKIKSAKVIKYAYETTDENGIKEFNERDEGVLGSITIELECEEDECDEESYYVKDGKKYERITHFLGRVLPEPNFGNFWEGVSPEAQKRMMNKFAAYGTAIHDLSHAIAESYGPDHTLPDCNIVRLLDELQPRQLITERKQSITVFDQSISLAGTTDWHIGVNGWATVDLKSGSSHSKKNELQSCFNAKLAGFSKALIVYLGVQNKKGYRITTLNKEDIDKGYEEIVQLRKLNPLK